MRKDRRWLGAMSVQTLSSRAKSLASFWEHRVGGAPGNV